MIGEVKGSGKSRVQEDASMRFFVNWSIGWIHMDMRHVRDLFKIEHMSTLITKMKTNTLFNYWWEAIGWYWTRFSDFGGRWCDYAAPGSGKEHTEPISVPLLEEGLRAILTDIIAVKKQRYSPAGGIRGTSNVVRGIGKICSRLRTVDYGPVRT